MNGSSIFDFAESLQETGLKKQMLGVSPWCYNVHTLQPYNPVYFQGTIAIDYQWYHLAKDLISLLFGQLGTERGKVIGSSIRVFVCWWKQTLQSD
jgi:hypothetical protein